MLTLKTLRENPELVVKKLGVKHFDAQAIVEKVIALDDRRKAIQQESDALLGQQKKAAAEIGALMKAGKKEEAETAKAKVAQLKARSAELLKEADETAQALQDSLVLLPNLPCDLVPEGKGAEDNLVVKMGGEEPKLPENALPHWDLAKKYDIIDFDLGVKITGATAYFADNDGMVGSIIQQKAVAVYPDDTPETLRTRVLEQAEWKLLIEALSLYCQGRLSRHGNRILITGEK